MARKKAWSIRDRPVEVVLNNRHFGASVFGAIGNCLTKPVFAVYDRNNKVNFIKFMKRVRQSLKIEFRRERNPIKPFLVLDNASSHRANDSVRYLETHFRPLFMVPYSSPANSIERVWNLSKRAYEKKAMVLRHELNEQQFRDMVREVLNSLPPEKVNACITSNRAHLASNLN